MWHFWTREANMSSLRILHKMRSPGADNYRYFYANYSYKNLS
jgi:hypothetical protein